MFPTPQSSDPHTAPPLPLGLALSQETQARLARVPLPNHNHFTTSGNQPQYLTSVNSGRPVVDRSNNQLQPQQHLSTTSPTRWRTSPTRLDPTRSEVANQASSYQLTTSPTPSSSSPLNSQTSPSRRASDQGALWSSRRSQIEPNISPSRRTSAPHEHRGHLENYPQEINETHLAPFDSRLPVSNLFLCQRCFNIHVYKESHFVSTMFSSDEVDTEVHRLKVFNPLPWQELSTQGDTELVFVFGFGSLWLLLTIRVLVLVGRNYLSSDFLLLS